MVVAPRVLSLLLLLCLPLPVLADSERPPYDSGRLDYRLRVREDLNPYRVFGVFVLPGEVLPLRVEEVQEPVRRFQLESDAGEVVTRGEGEWRWRAPERPGHYEVRVRPERGEPMLLNVFVMVPRQQVKRGYLNGYRIGEYPLKPLKGLAIYRAPAGFIELREGDESIQLSPHFTIGQFLCKQTGGYPKYLALRERLVLKLELVLTELNRAGHRLDGLHVMSGFRTPHYNAAIGNVPFSRHVWGGAADVFPDENPRDGYIDDLNGDGVSDVRDAHWLYDLIDGLYQQPFYAGFTGGLGSYRENSVHGPFVHIDVRGTRARWGR